MLLIDYVLLGMIKKTFDQKIKFDVLFFIYLEK
jgi:hypothetical protein